MSYTKNMTYTNKNTLSADVFSSMNDTTDIVDSSRSKERKTVKPKERKTVKTFKKTISVKSHHSISIGDSTITLYRDQIFCLVCLMLAYEWKDKVVPYGAMFEQKTIALGETVFTLVVGVWFLLTNVFPKYIKMDEADRHLYDNETTAICKKAMMVDSMENNKFTLSIKNYGVLLLHIIFGGGSFVLCGFSVVYYSFVDSTYVMSLFMRNLIILLDTGHQLSIIALVRNHDGIMNCRSGNVALAATKAILCVCIFDCDVAETDRLHRMINCLMILAAGFAYTRFFCTISYIFSHYLPQTIGRTYDENWYSIGLFGAQLYVFASTDTLFFFVLAPLSWVFVPHKLWYGKSNHFHFTTTIFVFITLLFVKPEDENRVKLLVILVQAYFGFNYCGLWWKRNRLSVEKEKEITKTKTFSMEYTETEIFDKKRKTTSVYVGYTETEEHGRTNTVSQIVTTEEEVEEETETETTSRSYK